MTFPRVLERKLTQQTLTYLKKNHFTARYDATGYGEGKRMRKNIREKKGQSMTINRYVCVC